MDGESRVPRPRQSFRSWRNRFVSVRWRLTLWYVGMLTAALLVFGGVIYAWQAATVYVRVRGETQLLRQEAGQIATAAASSGRQVRMGAEPIGGIAGEWAATPVIVSPPTSDDIALVIGPDGTIRQRSGPVSDADVEHILGRAGRPPVGADGTSFVVEQIGHGPAQPPTDYQFHAVAFQAGDGSSSTFILGRPNTAIGQLRSLTVTLLGAGVVTLLAVGAGGYWLASRAMRPVQVITRTAREIGETDLSRRLNQPNRDELGELAATFDTMLGRLEAAFQRQRQFTNDASHELRTPLTIVKLETERALGRPNLPPEQAQALATIEAETAYMTDLVHNLLTLARADAGPAILDRTVVDLSDIALDVVERLAPLARQSGLEIVIGKLPELPVVGDRRYLTQMLSNLIENAVKYTGGHGTQVHVDAGRSGTSRERWGWVWVTDTGPGIAPEHLPHLFDRFYRVDRARTNDAADDGHQDLSLRGSGLGLAIVQWVAQSHGGAVRVESEVGKGSVFIVRLPLVQPDDGWRLGAP